MKHNFVRVESVSTLGDYRLSIRFDNDREKDIDFLPVLYGEMYSALRDKNLFKAISVDREIGTLVWPNGADFDPSLLYCWEEIIDELSSKLKKVSTA